MDVVSGVRTDGYRGGDVQDCDGDILNMWEDTAANIILGTEHNSPLAYDPRLELHHLTMHMLEGLGGRL